jgi:ATP-dependent Lon protease
LILSKENEKDLVDVPEEVREDLTIHTVDMIDEVLQFALESTPVEESIVRPQVWGTETTSADITTSVE